MCLAVKADGTKMTPYVVTPAEKVKKELANISGAIVTAIPNGWINDNLTVDWVEKGLDKFFLCQTYACVGFVQVPYI